MQARQSDEQVLIAESQMSKDACEHWRQWVVVSVVWQQVGQEGRLVVQKLQLSEPCLSPFRLMTQYELCRSYRQQEVTHLAEIIMLEGASLLGIHREFSNWSLRSLMDGRS